jgi:hypothetical protein
VCVWQLLSNLASQLAPRALFALMRHLVTPCKPYRPVAHAFIVTLSLLSLQDSDDIRYMAGALKALGIKLEENWEEGLMTVHGCGGRFPVEVRGAGSQWRCGEGGDVRRMVRGAVPMEVG